MGKCTIFGKMYYFWKNILFLAKYTIFGKIYYFWQNILFLAKCTIFGKMYYFWTYLGVPNFSTISFVALFYNQLLWHRLFHFSVYFIYFALFVSNISYYFIFTKSVTLWEIKKNPIKSVTLLVLHFGVMHCSYM